MNLLWLPLAIVSYLLMAVNGAADRIIVHKGVTAPAVIAFWVALFSTSTLGLLLVGLVPGMDEFRYVAPDAETLGLVLLAGVLTQAGLHRMYLALDRGEATRVLSVMGAAGPVLTFVFAALLLGERLAGLEILAFIILLFGSVVLTASARRGHLVWRARWLADALLASGLIGLQAVLAKIIFDRYHFISAFALMSLGALIYALLLVVLSPAVRQALWGHKAKATRNSRSQFWLVIGNSMLGGVAVIIMNLALKLGSPTFISALRGVQYAGVFAIALLLANGHARLMDEQLTKRALTQKISGIVLVINGVALLALSA